MTITSATPLLTGPAPTSFTHQGGKCDHADGRREKGLSHEALGLKDLRLATCLDDAVLASRDVRGALRTDMFPVTR